MEEIFKELAPHKIASFPKLYGIDFSPTTMTFYLFVAMIIAFFVIWLGARKPKLIPSGWQNAIEALLEFIRNSIVLDTIGPEGAKYFPFIATLFIYILVANLIGLIPGAKTATSVTSVTGAWAIMVFLLYNWIGVRKQGPIKYLGSFAPKGVPLVLKPVMFLLEIVSHLLRPFSLAVRLFANMIAGHLVLGIFTLFAVQIGRDSLAMWPAKAIPMVVVVGVMMFELFVSAIQAYIFSVLTSIYISGALSEEH